MDDRTHTFDIEQLFAEQVGDGPAGRTPEGDLAAGRRRRTRHRIATGAGAVLASCAIAAGALAVGANVGGDDPGGRSIDPAGQGIKGVDGQSEPSAEPTADTPPETTEVPEFTAKELRRGLKINAAGKLRATDSSISIIKQRTPSGLPTNFADPAAGDVSAVAQIQQAGEYWWASARRFGANGSSQVIVVRAVTMTDVRSLDDFVDRADELYSGDEGLL